MPPYAFPKRHREKHITFKELHAVVHAVELFGRGARWEDREIVVNTDNTEVAAAAQTGYIKHVASQSLLRRLWLSAAAGRFRISTIWLPSNDNGLADALSRFDWIKAQDIDPIAWRALQRRQSRNLSSLHPLPPQDRSRYFPPRRLVPNPTVAVSNHPRKTSWTLSSSIATRHTTFGSASERELAQPTTRRRRFSKWASGQGFFPFPATTPALCRWAGCMASNGLRPGTVRGSLAGLRFFHTDTGLDDAAFDSTQLGRVLRGIRRDAGALERRLRIPITLPILASILSALRSLAGVSDRDRVATGSPCRRHMLLHTSERSDRGSLPTVRATSTPLSIAPAQMAETVAITRSCVSRRQNRTPTGRTSISSSPRLRPTPSSIPSPYSVTTCASTPWERNSPLFARAGSYPAAFQKSWFVDTLRRSITAAGIEAKHFSGHSFRRGLATWAKLSAKLGDDDIRLLGRWSSNAVRLYQESTPAQLANISRATFTVNPSAPTGILPPAAYWWGDE